MADGRKRAKKGGGEGTPPEKPGSSQPVTPAPDDAAFSPPRWVSSEETLTFPNEPYSPAGPASSQPDEGDDLELDERAANAAQGRIALPSSGLASEILSRQDAMGVEPSFPAPSPRAAAPAEPPQAPLVPRSPQSSALFGPQGRDDRKAAPELMEHLVTFYLSDEEYGLDVRVVQEIIRLSETTHVPRAPGFIKGVINLRGRIIPVVDLKRKLELGEVAPNKLARIVVVKLRDRLIGLLVDGASQVLKIPVSSIDQAPEEILDVSASFIRGVAKLEKRLIILLDLYKILAMEIEHAAAQ
jgi:purine-binding chemotaxis protein CheW